jgi:LacI family transcriptional regulator
MLLRRRVDGVVLVPASFSGEAVRALQAQDVKVVVLDRRLKDVAVDVVRGASTEGARRLVQHLIKLGHRRIAVLTGPSNLSTANERAAGYRRALDDAQILYDQALVLFGSYTVESGIAMTAKILQLEPRPTAIFAANNFLAVGALRTLQEHGLQVPADMSLVSFEDLPFDYSREPFLTVAKQPAYELGSTAAKLLLQRVIQRENVEHQEIVLPTELIIRSSTAAHQENTGK